MAATNENPETEQQGVRFATQNEEISPQQSLQSVQSLTGRPQDDLDVEAQQELQQLRTTLQNNIQSSRMQHHTYEPVSLPGSQPVSRVPSGTTTPSRRHLPAGSAVPSPRASPPTTAVHSPPLTPAATHSRDGKASVGLIPAMRPAPDVMTPQRSESPQRQEKSVDDAGGASEPPKKAARFSIGPSGDSQPPSGEVSPAGTPAGTAPVTPASSRPFIANKQPPRDSIDARFRFGNRDPAQGYTNSGQANVNLPAVPTLPRSSASGASLQALDNKRSSFFGGKKHDDDSSSNLNEKHSSSSKSNLKRFFKFGCDHHQKHKDKNASSNGASGDGTKTPPSRSTSTSLPSVPFADDHGLQTRYGKFGKILGSGAGGSVRLMKRTGDGTTFAVKQFRDRHAYESEREYNKKVTAEFCIGSTLHHGNVIETIDIVHEKGKWYVVMEYAPFDLFATVMAGKMTRDEITCATLQILSGVCYLHTMGLAHRDLKLDNVVINEHGIMKLIDFGSAVVFRYPFENEIVLATGVVGSDPYLAPEVYENTRYDPRPADVWSIAIIYCCMTLRRFPWKAPRISDHSYRLFISPPDPDQARLLDEHRRSLTPRSNRGSVASVDGDERRQPGMQSVPASRNPTRSGDDDADASSEHHKHHHHHHHHEQEVKAKSEPVSRQQTATGEQPTIKGPLRLLRLLPRETRHIIGRMLELEPKNRATMDEILSDPWVRNALVCGQEENGQIFKAPGHTHTMQPSGGDAK